MVYRLGSKGPMVEQIQIIVGAHPDGDFGPRTEEKVKLWQLENGLADDGVVGPFTLGRMGLVDTDESERLSAVDNTRIGGIDIKQAFLPMGEYYKGPVDKTHLFGHHTAGWEDPYKTISSWGKDKRGEIATEFVIGGQKVTTQKGTYDGEIVQAFPKGGYAWHLGVGRRPVHINSIGIEVNNFGQLTQNGYYKKDEKDNKIWIEGKPNTMYTYTGTEVHPDQVIRLNQPFRGYEFWHNYSDAQIESMRKLIIHISKRDDIDVSKGLPEMIKEVGAHNAFDFCDVNHVEKHPGFWMHTNVRPDKVDMYPHPKLVKMLLTL